MLSLCEIVSAVDAPLNRVKIEAISWRGARHREMIPLMATLSTKLVPP